MPFESDMHTRDCLRALSVSVCPLAVESERCTGCERYASTGEVRWHLSIYNERASVWKLLSLVHQYHAIEKGAPTRDARVADRTLQAPRNMVILLRFSLVCVDLLLCAG